MEETVVHNAYTYFAPVVEDLGYEVVEIDFRVLYGNPTLTIYIDCPTGISLEDCERVNDALDAPADRYDISNGKPYHLNISSPGLDRPIVSDADYRRNTGREVEAHLNQKLNKKSKIVGILKGRNEDCALIESDGEEIAVPIATIRVMHRYIKF